MWSSFLPCCIIRDSDDVVPEPIKATDEFDDEEFFTPRGDARSRQLLWNNLCGRKVRAVSSDSPYSRGAPAPFPPKLRRPALLRNLTKDLTTTLVKAQRPEWLDAALCQASKTLSRSLSDLDRALRPNRKYTNFNGQWTCVHTWGLEDFLRDCGASELQVWMAQKAPCPRWEFIQKGNQFVYINHNSFCDLREEFEVDGPEYIAIDTRKKERRSRARWDDATLVIDRQGEDGQFRESRHINSDGELVFTLVALKPGMEGKCWGRTFKRKEGGESGSGRS
jgi:hypothetical protein